MHRLLGHALEAEPLPLVAETFDPSPEGFVHGFLDGPPRGFSACGVPGSFLPVVSQAHSSDVADTSAVALWPATSCPVRKAVAAAADATADAVSLSCSGVGKPKAFRRRAASSFFVEEENVSDSQAYMGGPPPVAGFGGDNDSPCMSCACERPRPGPKGPALEATKVECPRVNHHRYYTVRGGRVNLRKTVYAFFFGSFAGSCLTAAVVGSSKASQGKKNDDGGAEDGGAESEAHDQPRGGVFED
eukprot:TRINITY_DN20932_c0_g1_i1.p1 TRINITY_DN20932_c0_g1~~TRINITY_DN20932_c0_g1_i1.p1  ORF type:complete len:245 (+),score=40.71 TRINITY_DN20932_c0_g1_i1:128-862(+)